jgi:hypothetical protein
VTATLELALGAEGTETATYELEGTAVVIRQDPEKGEDGVWFVTTELTELQLQGDGDFGPVSVTLHPDKPSFGDIRQREKGDDYPADGSFRLFAQIDAPDRNLTARNENPLPLLVELDAVPPGQRETFEQGENFVIPIYTSDSQQAGSINRLTLTLGPAQTTELTTPQPEG